MTKSSLTRRTLTQTCRVAELQTPPPSALLLPSPPTHTGTLREKVGRPRNYIINARLPCSPPSLQKRWKLSHYDPANERTVPYEGGQISQALKWIISHWSLKLLDCVQTILNDPGSDTHLDYLNDMKIWADWIMCIVKQGGRRLVFTNTDWFNNNNQLRTVLSNMYKIGKFCALQLLKNWLECFWCQC